MIDDTLLEAEDKMEKAVSVTKEELATIRTGRAHPAMFNRIMVNYYGAMTPLNQLASFHIPEPRMIVISPYDKSSLAGIERAIRDSDLGVNPGNDGTIIRVVFPELSEERRREYIKVGALIAVAGGAVNAMTEASPLSQGLGFLALVLASVNIFGGFLVTQRMLAMYQKKS